MKRGNKITLLVAVMLGIMISAPTPVVASGYSGTMEADSGTIMAYNGFWEVYEEHDTSFTYVSKNAYGDLYVKGDHDGIGSHVLTNYCLIKVKPVSSNLHYLELKASGGFQYGLSAGWLSQAKWDFDYVVFNSDTGLVVGRSWYAETDTSNTDNTWWYPDNDYWVLYSQIGFVTSYGYYCDNQHWYTVGVRIVITLGGSSDIYQTYNQQGNAHWNPNAISFRFVSSYDPTPP